MSTDPQQPDPQQQEQMRQYIEQLRQAEPAEIIAQAFTMLGTGAEVKLGRPDARVLIDALAGLVGAVEGRVPEQLIEGMRSGVAQLQQAQVQAEQVSQQSAESAPGEDASEGPATEPPGQPRPQAEQGGGQAPQDDDQRMTDRLWIPGRDQPPSAR